MFTLEELMGRSVEATASLLHARTEPLLGDPSAPAHLRDLAIMFELDHQLRNGGFAQYFFNESCANAFDAWFATEGVEEVAHELLGAALLRVGAEFDIDLDLQAMLQTPKKLGPAYGQLLQVNVEAHVGPSTLLQDFARFRDRLSADRGEAVGFDALNRRFFEASRLPHAIVEVVRGEPEAFSTGS